MKAWLALGSNLGDRARNLRQAVSMLNAHPEIFVSEISCLYETEPVQMADDDAGWFMNAAVAVETSLEPKALLDACMTIERQLGRDRTHEPAGYQSRTLDLDILFYDDRIIEEEQLIIPHPRLQERAFVLVPMLELAPDLLHPRLQKTIRQLHLDLPAPEDVRLSDALTVAQPG